MAKVLLQNMISHIKFDALPANWNHFDIENFSKSKKLWDYQQEAIVNAIKVLWKYYEDVCNYQENESLDKNDERKEKFFNWYRNNDLNNDLDINLDRKKRDIYYLLTQYYPPENGKISYRYFINRMCFWMATGSGKSLVIIKLIQILNELIKRKEIPPWDILVLTHRDDLIEQLKRHVEEFNKANAPKIVLRELKEYPNVKREPILFGIPVFYYRSDNLSDEQKEKIIDYKNYDNEGRWYIFLDEAHKGDKEESKRQHIFSILSRNGFLFNFSATFIDERDIVTTAFEFNLSSFIDKGYGKHICILNQELRTFRDDEDYSEDEKQKIVLKTLIILTYIKKFCEEVKRVKSDLYHNPLLLTLVNSVNTEDADLKLFFRELERIGKGEVDDDIFKKAVEELWDELKEEPKFIWEDDKVKINKEKLCKLTMNDILEYIYNASSPGETEVIVRPSNRRELAFKLKTSEKPFALIKIGDISGWLKDELKGYEIQERFGDESYFEALNREDSTINILMGSRGFYEGWDSNRPNVINFINIGTEEDAKKFILQSVGRGVRIEPITGKRKRLLPLYNAKEIDGNLFNSIKDKVLPLETLFIFGTNRKVLKKVIEEIKREKKWEYEYPISLFVNEEIKKDKLLLVPVYKEADYSLTTKERKIKFEISNREFDILKRFIDFIEDDRILLMRYDTEPQKINILKQNLTNTDCFKFNQREYKNIDLIIQRFFDYLKVVPEEFKEFKELEEEIRHFKNIKVYLKDIYEIQQKIERVKNFPQRIKELEEAYGKISYEEFMREREAINKEETFEYNSKKIKIKHILNHYYLPVILSEDEKVDYITHIIKTKSEVDFINDLEKYLEKNDNKFKEFDWWMFSKIDESLDEVYLPYYNPNTNKVSRFYPDFIFWLTKGQNYFIVFVDPKSETYTIAERKIDGYEEIFMENNKEKIFNHNGLNVRVKVFLRSDGYSSEKYKEYWFDSIDKMLEKVLSLLTDENR